jgi:hypothetical protein
MARRKRKTKDSPVSARSAPTRQQHLHLFGATDPRGFEAGGERRICADERRDIAFEKTQPVVFRQDGDHRSPILDHRKCYQGTYQSQTGRRQHDQAKAEDKRFVDRLFQRDPRSLVDIRK